MSAQEIIDKAKEIRQRLRYPPNAVPDPGIDLTRKSTAYKGNEPNPDPPVKKALEEPKQEISYPPIDIKFPVLFSDIVDAVSTHYGVTPTAIYGASRRAHTCFARFVVIHLAFRLMRLPSFKAIGRFLNKDHSSIIHAKRRIEAIIAGNSQVAAEVQMIGAYIEANHRSAVPAVSECGLEVQQGASPQVQEVHRLADGLLGPLASAEAHPEA